MSMATLRLSPLPREEGGAAGGATCLPFCIIHAGVLGARGLGCRQPERGVRGAGPPERQQPGVQT